MKKFDLKMPYLSADAKRKTVGLVSILLVLSALIFFFLKDEEKVELLSSNARYYDTVKAYVQTEYVEAYSDFYDVLYVEELGDYDEKLSADGKSIEATFIMKAHYRYPYRDPDTVPIVIEARESGDMAEYKRLYDGYNQMQSADYPLKIIGVIEENTLSDVTLYAGREDGSWDLLQNGFKDYITE